MSKSFFFPELECSTPVLIPYYREYGYSALNHARSLGRLGVPVYAAGAIRRHLLTESSRYIRNVYPLDPIQPGHESKILDSIIKISRIIGRKPVLGIIGDEFAKFCARFKDVLREHFFLPRLDVDLVETLCDKKKTHFLALKHGIPTVRTEFPESIDDVIAFSDRSIFPVAMKAADFSDPEGRPPQKLMVFKSPKALLDKYVELSANSPHPNIILQDYVKREASHEWIFSGYFDEQSRPLFVGSAEKLRKLPVFGGSTTLGLTCTLDIIISMSVDFLKAIRYSGIVDIDYIYDPTDDLFKVLDVNPRVGANFRIFRSENGLDVVRVMYFHLTGQSVPSDTIIDGRKWIVEDADLISALISFKHGNLSLLNWIRSLIGVKECAWFAFDDLEPFVRQEFGVMKLMSKRFMALLRKRWSR